jgi:CPA2 family monovalent cation:H+ antiporter-2
VTLVADLASVDPAMAFIEIGAVAIVLSVLARLAGRLGITAVPLYLLAGLAVGKGGIAPLDVSDDFMHLAGEIGVLLLLLTLGLAYSPTNCATGCARARCPASWTRLRTSHPASSSVSSWAGNRSPRFCSAVSAG